jgi:hypothetical protein
MMKLHHVDERDINNLGRILSCAKNTFVLELATINSDEFLVCCNSKQFFEHPKRNKDYQQLEDRETCLHHRHHVA